MYNKRRNKTDKPHTPRNTNKRNVWLDRTDRNSQSPIADSQGRRIGWAGAEGRNAERGEVRARGDARPPEDRVLDRGAFRDCRRRRAACVTAVRGVKGWVEKAGFTWESVLREVG